MQINKVNDIEKNVLTHEISPSCAPWLKPDFSKDQYIEISKDMIMIWAIKNSFHKSCSNKKDFFLQNLTLSYFSFFIGRYVFSIQFIKHD